MGIKALFHKHREVITYLFFGVLTTAVNWLVYFPLYNLLHLDATISNIIAWIISVAFAFLTNKPFVFNSHDWHLKVWVPEAIKFVSARVLSGLFEIGALFLLVNILGFDGNIFKIAVSVFVVIINYVASKVMVFRK